MKKTRFAYEYVGQHFVEGKNERRNVKSQKSQDFAQNLNKNVLSWFPSQGPILFSDVKIINSYTVYYDSGQGRFNQPLYAYGA